MSKLNHEFFGVLDTAKDLAGGLENAFSDGIGVLWEKEYNGSIVTLWYDNAYELKINTLDAFAKLLKNLEEYKKTARLALKEYLKKDDEYITFHKEELESDVPADVSEFVEKMQIKSIALWAGEDFIAVDFMIDPEESDEILCVKFNRSLEVESIDWES
ncbi:MULTISPECIES: DUF2004 domain-containing protein [unclassified Treponema]|uniref:DUF2004 domain-containing protein n=1 Tax=unclassified Treponema TaxID=2638727 RepID=UPI0020A5A5AC|nr:MULTISPECIES: DUF2004 domain-containing protein [unclassified Treponema]UTC66798.1 DUF2004 domain-containing protein [Treponema sp. OMZ 789]UTC69531.1 DUF2004 domain-containing protein [Treponema sp. OMZ 790]UTC72245.1 DUF2004 domain-containing protein [Treponema sp. OMZ 791]